MTGRPIKTDINAGGKLTFYHTINNDITSFRCTLVLLGGNCFVVTRGVLIYCGNIDTSLNI